MKISVEVDVPDGEFCRTRKEKCSLMVILGWCMVSFRPVWKKIKGDKFQYYSKCPACLTACAKAKKGAR